MGDHQSASPSILSQLWSWMKRNPWSFALAPLILIGGLAVVVCLSLLEVNSRDARQMQAQADELKRQQDTARTKAEADRLAAEAELARARAGITIAKAPEAPKIVPTPPARSAEDIARDFNNLGGFP